MTQHTPGRAKITFGQLVIGDYETGIVAIHLTPAKHPVSEGIANLQRIVDCWNQQATIDRLQAEKADSLGALEYVQNILAQGANIATGLTGREHTVKIKLEKDHALTAFRRVNAAIATARL